jgi:F-type H+-transporting ATPase subunit b
MVDISLPILAIQIANFLVLILLLNIMLYKPIRGILRQRKEKLQGLEASIAATTQQADERNTAFSEGLKNARLKGQSQKEALVQAATQEEQAIVAKINNKAKEELDAVRAKIAKDTDAVRASLEKEVDAFAVAITNKILGRAA